MDRKFYYVPYQSDESDSESDSEFESDSGYTSDSSIDSSTVSGPGSEAPTLVMGQGIPDDYGEQVKKDMPVAKLIPNDKTIDASKNTSLVMIASRDRDTRVYPQPTFFTIRLPKTFKNIKTITITQINLLNSFFNFSTTKGNTFMYVQELDRLVENSAGEFVPNSVKVQIRNGTYSALDLVTELSNAMNQTPIFSDITGGLGTFIQDFQGTGDYTLLFNQPGPVVYNSLTGQYESNVTMSQLVARYFQTVQTVGTVSYSYNQCLVAYYYPVINEMTARSIPFNTYDSSLPTGFTRPYDYILFGFQGLDDPYILTLIDDPENVVLFDNFRYENTFNQFLINQYVCRYNSLQGRLQISATSLTPSIQSDLTLQYNTILNEEVINNGFSTVAAFQSQYNAISQENGAMLEYYNFIHKNFTNTFGINFGAYTPVFFANGSNDLTLYNIADKKGWNTKLQPNVSLNAKSSSTAMPSQVSTPLTNIQIYQKSAYDFAASTFLSKVVNLSTIGFSNASETTYGYTDIPFSIAPTSYALVNFTSRCRQTVNLMTIPRYITDRNSNTDEVYNFGPTGNQTPLLYQYGPNTVHPQFSTLYIRTDISGSIDFNLYDISQVMFTSADYMRAENRWISYIRSQILSGKRIQQGADQYGGTPPINDMVLLSYRPHLFFQLTTDTYILSQAAKWKVDIHVETQDGQTFAAPITVARYRDRAAFMIDVEQDLAKNYTENPRHVFEKQTYGTDVSGAVLTIEVLNNQTSYISIHIANNDIIPNAIPLRVFAILHDDYGVYTQATLLDYRELPYKDLPPIADQYTPESDIYKSPLTSIYDPSIFKLGYDISGVSNNLLDFFIQGSDGTYYDPANISNYLSGTNTGLRYFFDYKTPAATIPAPDSTTPWSLYFGNTSQNLIRDTYGRGSNNIYLNSSITQKALQYDGNEFLLVNWFNSINKYGIVEEYLNPAPFGNTSTDYMIGQTSGIFLSCKNSNPSLVTDVSTNTSYQDTTGFHGLSFFLNPNDIVKLQNIELKMTYIQPTNDPLLTPFTRKNSPLGVSDTPQYTFQNRATNTSVYSSGLTDWDDWYVYNRRNVRIGIFNTSDISGADIQSLQLSDALMTMTLRKVSQVAKYTNSFGTFRTREPDWGTYYIYEPITEEDTLWDVSGSSWRVLNVGADTFPTYTAANTSYPGYFLTHTNINNNTFINRSYGIAPSVGHSVAYPRNSSYTPSYTSDIPNSYTIVPFYNDPLDNTWKVGSYYGVSYTRTPALPDPTITDNTAPYYGPPGIYGWTRNVSTITLANGGNSSFLPYYWNMKIDFQALDVDYDPATDLSIFGGFAGISNEFQDTMMFFYRNKTKRADFVDISGTNPDIVDGQYWQWGIERNSNYYAWDDQSGYNFLSYLNGLTVRSSSSEVYDYAVHVRGYVPTSKFTSGLRLIGKNYTDFGNATLTEIADEITDLSGYTLITNDDAYNYTTNPTGFSTIISKNDAIRIGSGKFYSHQYADTLTRFNNLFKYPNGIIFGKKIGFRGVRFIMNGYKDSINQYISYFSTLRGTTVAYTNVLSTTTGRLNQYVKSRYGNILPSNIINRTRVTDPIPFSFLFASKLEPPYITQYDNWGLGWNLGFNKEDTAYLTTQVSNTFIRITQDYIYLRLNPEMNMNTMGVSSKEDLSVSRETFGQDQKYFAKILLNNFGGFCRAAVQMPKEFNPVLGKYDTISLQLVDADGNQIDNVDCEYDVVMELSEVVDGARNKFAIAQGQ